VLQEARIVSQLNHPGIVKLFDAIEHRGRHYLVLEYVEGTTLDHLLRSQGRLDKFRAVKIASQIAGGLVYAHGQHVIHRDIKPANIMIDDNGDARIMDFGIATSHNQLAPTDTLSGTPRYMAPEYMANKPAGETADVFSLGAVLYEMLAGEPAVSGANVYEVMHKIANEPFRPPSQLNPEIDEGLEQLVLKALNKDEAQRYASAAAMMQALDAYLAPSGDLESPPVGGKDALGFLLRRIQQKSNFPALSQSISAINRISPDSDESIQTLSAVLLKDFSITNKLLRLVNSPTYGQFGGTISTISRSVMILGFDTVRNLAITLILFEHLQNKTQASQLKERVIAAYFSGIMARRATKLCGVQDGEESFICGVFHHLGKLLCTYYFFDESLEITKRIELGDSEEKASRAVLGTSYEELGIEVARSWDLPEKIVVSMQHVAHPQRATSDSPKEKLRLVSNLATALCRVASESPASDKAAELGRLEQNWGGSLKLSKDQLATIVKDSVSEFLVESSMFVANSAKSQALQAIRKWAGDKVEAVAAKTPADAGGGPADAAGPTADEFVNQTTIIAAAYPAVDAGNSAAMLTAGIQDITNSLVDEFNLNDVLRIILETMYRAVGFSQVLLCTREIKGNLLKARFGFGAKIDSLLTNFNVPLGKTQDVFELALERNVDLFIADTRADNIVSRIPAWYREKINSQTFLLLPIVIGKKAVGMFYADRDLAGQLTIEPEQLKLLKTLRNQAIIAIRHKF
jgi:serine/threonine protein kinase